MLRASFRQGTTIESSSDLSAAATCVARARSLAPGLLPYDPRVAEALRLGIYGLGWLALLAGLGSGPAFLLAGCRYPPLVLAPVLGGALGAALMTTASVVLTMSTAAFALLLPAAVVSVLVAVMAAWRTEVGVDLAELVVPASLGLVGLFVALVPGFVQDNVGPLIYAVADAWQHATQSIWLAGHTSATSADPQKLAGQLPVFAGWADTHDGFRIGLPSLNAAFARLAGTRPEETYYSLGAATLALLPSSIWLLSRRLGAGRLAASLGAVYGIAAVALTLVVDGAAENLLAMALAPLAFLFGFEALAEDGRRRIVLAGLTWGGLLAVYPEYVPPLGLAAAIVAILALALGGRDSFVPLLLSWARRLGGIVLTVVLVAPYSLVRDFDYYRWLPSHAAGGAARHLTLENVGAWAFGVLHLYQLQNFGLLSAPKHALAVGLPLVLLAVAVAGVVRGPRTAVPYLVVPAAVSVLAAVYLYWFRTDNEYALWKWLLLAIPFLAALVALGFQWLVEARWARPFLIVLSVAVVASVAYTDVRFTRLLDARAVFVPDDARALVSDAAPLRPPSIFLEGPDATPYPLVDYVGLYATLLQIPGVRVSYDPEAGGPAAQGNQLLVPVLPVTEYEDPSYRYVLTTFGGLRRPGRTISSRGRFALVSRSPVDVVVTGVPAWTVVRGGTVPYAVGPFQLWISAPRARSVRLVVGTVPTKTPLLALSVGGKPLSTVALRGGAVLCATVHADAGFTRVDAQPLTPMATATEIHVWQSDVERVNGAPPITQAPGVTITGVGAAPAGARGRGCG
jgi:hypothetical protein